MTVREQILTKALEEISERGMYNHHPECKTWACVYGCVVKTARAALEAAAKLPDALKCSCQHEIGDSACAKAPDV